MPNEECPGRGDSPGHTFPRAMRLTAEQAAAAQLGLDAVETRPFDPATYYAQADGELIFEDEGSAGFQPAMREVVAESAEPSRITRRPDMEDESEADAMPGRQFFMDRDGFPQAAPPSPQARPRPEGTFFMREDAAIAALETGPRPIHHFMNDDPSVEGNSVGRLVAGGDSIGFVLARTMLPDARERTATLGWNQLLDLRNGATQDYADSPPRWWLSADYASFGPIVNFVSRPVDDAIRRLMLRLLEEAFERIYGPVWTSWTYTEATFEDNQCSVH